MKNGLSRLQLQETLESYFGMVIFVEHAGVHNCEYVGYSLNGRKLFSVYGMTSDEGWVLGGMSDSNIWDDLMGANLPVSE